MISRSTRADDGRFAGGAVTHWFVLVLIMLFAALSIALIALGAQAYRAIERHADEHVQRRTAVGYVLNRVKALDGAADIRVEQMQLGDEQTQVLVFQEEIDGDAYETRLYCADGMLREQFVSAEIPLEHISDGEGICELNRFLIIIDANLLRFEFTHADGGTDVVHAALRAESGVAK